jgi:hypothetical protein
MTTFTLDAKTSALVLIDFQHSTARQLAPHSAADTLRQAVLARIQADASAKSARAESPNCQPRT